MLRDPLLKCTEQDTEHGELRDPLLKCSERDTEHGELQVTLLKCSEQATEHGELRDPLLYNAWNKPQNMECCGSAVKMDTEQLRGIRC